MEYDMVTMPLNTFPISHLCVGTHRIRESNKAFYVKMKSCNCTTVKYDLVNFPKYILINHTI